MAESPLTIDLSKFRPEPAVAQVRQAAARGLLLFGEAVMTDSKENFVPVDLGNLRASGHVRGPFFEAGDIAVRLGFGGPAVQYALIVHEDMTARHTVGQAKYLELPVIQNAPKMAPFVAMHIRAVTG